MLIRASEEGNTARIDEIRAQAAHEYPDLFVSDEEEMQIAMKLGLPYRKRGG